MPTPTPPNVPEGAGAPGPEAPHMNGAAPAEPDNTPTLRRRVVLGALILFAAAWTVALIYSVTAGGRSPERLDDPTAKVVATACIDAQRAFTALPQVPGPEANTTALATRVAAEDAIFTKMITELRALHPKGEAPAVALKGWLDDWQSLITARERFVNNIHTEGASARFVEPATQGIKPIADKMNNWTLEQGTRTDACNTGALQVEQIYGVRKYGTGSKS